MVPKSSVTLAKPHSRCGLGSREELESPRRPQLAMFSHYLLPAGPSREMLWRQSGLRLGRAWEQREEEFQAEGPRRRLGAPCRRPCHCFPQEPLAA